MEPIDHLFAYYKKHQDELVEQYNGRCIVIVDDTVVGDFGGQAEAYAFASAKYAAGTFLIQAVSPGTDAYTQTYHSRVAI